MTSKNQTSRKKKCLNCPRKTVDLESDYCCVPCARDNYKHSFNCDKRNGRKH